MEAESDGEVNYQDAYQILTPVSLIGPPSEGSAPPPKPDAFGTLPFSVPGEPVVPSHTGPGLHTGPGGLSGLPPLAAPSLGHPTVDFGVGATGPVAGSDQGFPGGLDIHTIPPELKKEGTDWFAIFSPKVKRQLDVALVHTLIHESVVCCVRFSADGRYLATGCNRTTQIYDVRTGRKICVLVDEAAGKASNLYIRSVCFTPDGKFLATGADDKRIRIWNIAKKHIHKVFNGHHDIVYSLDCSTDGRFIVSGSGDKTARIWDIVYGASKVLTDHSSLGQDSSVTSVAMSPNDQYVAAGSLDAVVRIWDVRTGQILERLYGHGGGVCGVAFTPDGKGLISGGLDKTLKFWDVSALGGGPGAVAKSYFGRQWEDKCTMNFTGYRDYVLGVAVSHDGQWVVSGSRNRGVQFFDAKNAAVQCMLQGHMNSVISIDMSPVSSILATGSGDSLVKICVYTHS
ncbi:WD40 repeat-like protein [Macrolepiota fuliginosa MF-IS2]|uniref:WD40 repeat-like protein n=1 Tax=Macrolepiota fuliginosa MF-IS2 TaxID=1400762 RepID=A0A9P5X0K9_9AGAR|nr:WD40 repeat-like protein [Macrolepiota fuliginosa MF-IS2]